MALLPPCHHTHAVWFCARAWALRGASTDLVRHFTVAADGSLDRDGILSEGELAVLRDELAVLADHLEAVRARRLPRRRDEDARRAVGVLKVGGDLVLDLNVVVLAEADVGADGGGHAADPLHQVELVRALVRQHAAALAGPRRPPAALVVVLLGAEPVGDDPVHAPQLAQLAALDHLAHLDVCGHRGTALSTARNGWA